MIVLEQYQIAGRGSARIAESIEEGINAGALGPGDLLPPIRDLAAQLGVSAGTVAAAYRLAGRRGLTTSDRRRGTKVRAWQHEHGPRTPAGTTRFEAAERHGRRDLPAPSRDSVADLASGNPDPLLLPDLAPLLARLAGVPSLPGMAGADGSAAYEAPSYGGPLFHPRLEEAATVRLARDGLPVRQLTCTSGALDAIYRILTTSLRPGDRVALEDPGWPSLLGGVRRWGLVSVPLPVDDEGPDPQRLWDVLAAGARAAVVTRQAQNPTGAALSPRRASDLAEVFARYEGALLIEDDHGDGIAGPDPTEVVGSVVAARPPGGRHAFVRSASKAYGPDLRVAVVAGDPATVSRIETSIASTSGWVSHLLQQLVAELWTDSSVAERVADAAAEYRRRRGALIGALEQCGVPAVGRTGLNVWVPLPPGASTDEASCVSELLAAGWRVAGGAPWRLVSSPALRVTVASLPAADAGRLATAVARALGGGRRSAY